MAETLVVVAVHYIHYRVDLIYDLFTLSLPLCWITSQTTYVWMKALNEETNGSFLSSSIVIVLPQRWFYAMLLNYQQKEGTGTRGSETVDH
jgi:hypothetical protein